VYSNEDDDFWSWFVSPPGDNFRGGPYRDLPNARLVIHGGVEKLTVRADPAEDLCSAVRTGHAKVARAGNGVEVSMHDGMPSDWRGRSELLLAGARSWEIEIHGGADRVRMDLSATTLRGFELHGGADKLEMLVGMPRGHCAMRIHGGVDKFQLRRPAGVGVRLVIRGGASQLTLDASHFHAVGGPTRWEGPGFRDAVDRFDIEIHGGADKLLIES